MRGIVISALGLLPVDCSIAGGSYAVHADTITALRPYTGKTVKVTPFTSDKPGKREIMCQGAVMIQTPGGVPFEQYVGDASRTELLVAGLAAESAPVTLTGHLERMQFSAAREAVWELQVTLNSSNGRRLSIIEKCPFN